MTEETAKALAEAMNRLAAAIERVSGGMGTIGGGIHIHHHGMPTYYPAQQPLSPTVVPWQTWCLSGMGGNQ